MCSAPDAASHPTIYHFSTRSQTTFVLFESASGFSVFEVKDFDEISTATDKVQAAVRCGAGLGGSIGGACISFRGAA